VLVKQILARPCYACARVSHFPFGPGRLQKSWAGLSGEGAARANVSGESPTAFGTFVLLQDAAAIADRPHHPVRIRVRIRRNYNWRAVYQVTGAVAIKIQVGSGVSKKLTRGIRALSIAAHLIKPVRKPDLLSSILHIPGRRARVESEARSNNRTDARTSRNLRILLVEGNRANQTVGLRLLEKNGGTRPSSPETDRKRSRKSSSMPRPHSPRWRQKFLPNRRHSPVMRGKDRSRQRKVRQRSEKTFSHTVDSRHQTCCLGAGCEVWHRQKSWENCCNIYRR